MVEIAYFLGRGRKMVLCLNDIAPSENPEVDGIKVRGRGGGAGFMEYGSPFLVTATKR